MVLVGRDGIVALGAHQDLWIAKGVSEWDAHVDTVLEQDHATLGTALGWFSGS